ncbi:site-specific integrase [bacterium]|nr:site-specific integrase [bacterium]
MVQWPPYLSHLRPSRWSANNNKTVHGTRKEAQSYLNGVLRDQDLGRFVEPTKLQLEAFLDRWLEEVAKPKLREVTYDHYSDLVRLYVRGRPIGRKLLSELTPFVIQEYYAELRKQNLGIPSLKKFHVVISSSLDQAIRWGLLQHNPAKSVEVPRLRGKLREEKLRVIGDQDQAQKFLQAALEEPNGLVFILALSAGLRPGEYLALTWSDLDLDQERLVVQRSLFRMRKGGWRFEPPKTKGSHRTVTLPTGLVELLRAHKASQPPVSPQKADLVFRTLDGEPLHAGPLRRTDLRRLLKKAGLDERLHLYSLRHSQATIMLQAGVNPKVMAERLGHCSVQLTLDVYSHVIPTMQRDVASKIDGILFEDTRD